MNLLKTRFFRHYKNKPYKYLGLVKHSETQEDLVLYETLYENQSAKLWVRPKAMFFENVEINGMIQPRFAPVQFTITEYTSIQDFPISQFSILHNEIMESTATTPKFAERLKNKKIYGLLIFDGATPVGMKLGYAEAGSLFYSWLGGTIKAYRGLGIASELMRVQHEWCKAQGYAVVETRSREPFTDMMRLNLALGFKITGTLIDPKNQLKVIFQKQLS
ncbi:MAG: DUF1653 domain-containing protein [Bdellovibrionaceae bacterium]|nr:DUF1653 domain-containing protein [Bdellovibrio sp.]